MSDLPAITLSSANYRALVRLSRKKQTSKRPPDRLFQHGFVIELSGEPNENGYRETIAYCISESGMEYLRFWRRLSFDIRLNRFLAVAALLISLLALLLEFQDRGILPPFPTSEAVSEQSSPDQSVPKESAIPA